jgi:hypothetical protein
MREDYIGHVNRFTAAGHLHALSLQEGLMHMQDGRRGEGMFIIIIKMSWSWMSVYTPIGHSCPTISSDVDFSRW